jgi:hypothetical protein
MMNDDLIHQLAMARQNHQSIKDGMAMLTKAVTESEEYKSLVCSLQAAMEIEATVLTEIEKVSRAEFEADKTNKHPHPTITFQNKTEVKLENEDELREWLFSNYRPAFTVDDGIVKKAALDKKIPSKFFTTTPYEKFTIATDLSKYLQIEKIDHDLLDDRQLTIT